MIRWLRIAAKATATLAFIALGILVGLFLVANGSWVPVDVPPWLADLTPEPRVQVWLPALIAGWLVATLVLAALLLCSMYYVWRRRQYEALVGRRPFEKAGDSALPAARRAVAARGPARDAGPRRGAGAGGDRSRGRRRGRARRGVRVKEPAWPRC